MGKFRFDAWVDWKMGKEKGTQKNIPIEWFSPGDGVNIHPFIRSDRAKDPPALIFVLDVMDQGRTFTLALQAAVAMQYLRPNWEIAMVYLNMYEGTRRIHGVATDVNVKRKMSVVEKGLQRMTFQMVGYGLAEYS